MLIFLLPSGEGARRACPVLDTGADEGVENQLVAKLTGESLSLPHPSLRATFSRWEKEKPSCLYSIQPQTSYL